MIPMHLSVTIAKQNEALFLKIVALGMKTPPVGNRTFCPSSKMVFYIPPYRNVKYQHRRGTNVTLP